MLKNALMRYIVYIVYFLGIGMVSSGIVLMPFNTMRYGSILVIGLLLFSTGSFVNEIILEKKQMSRIDRVKLIIISLTLAIGIGMISGGIAHFKESPGYVTFLIPFGIVISFVSFLVKNEIKLSKKENTLIAVSIVSFALLVHTGLNYAVVQLDMVENGGDVFKSHGM
jgi:hypothetical protein